MGRIESAERGKRGIRGLILIRYGVSLLAVFAVLGLFFSSAMVSAQIGSKSSEHYEKLFKENLRKGSLNLSGKKIGDRGLEVLLKQGFIVGLKKLDLRYNELSPVGARMLAEAPPFSKLKILVLKHNFFADEGAIAFAGSASFSGLESLQLGWNEIRDAGALALVGSQNFPNLKKLDLRGNFLADKTKDVLRASFAHLKSLRIFQSE